MEITEQITRDTDTHVQINLYNQDYTCTHLNLYNQEQNSQHSVKEITLDNVINS